MEKACRGCAEFVVMVVGYEPWHFIVQFRIHHQLLVISCTF